MNNYFKNLRRRAGTGPGCTRHRGRYGSPGSSGGGNFLLRMKGAAILVMLALCILPQKAAAVSSDWEDNFLFHGWYTDHNGYARFNVVLWDDAGTDEGFVSGNGLQVYASKDNGSTWTRIAQLRIRQGGSIDIENFWEGCYKRGYSYSSDWDQSTYYIGWNLPLEWRNCNIKFKSEGDWSDDDGTNSFWMSKIFGPYANNYTFSVRSISWNGDLGISPDGTLTLPYSFGSSAAETDGHTRISTHVDGTWSSQIAYHTPSSNYASDSYSFNLSKINKNLRSPSFTIRMDHEYPHENDLSGGTQYYKAQSSLKTFYPLPLATLSTPVFSQLYRTVSLSWTADNTNYGDGSWAIYRNDQLIDVVTQGTYSFTDDNPLFEANVKYYIYYVHSSWSDETKADLLKSNEQTVDTRLSLPIAGLSSVCEDDRIIFSWTSDGYPADYGHSFKIYVDDETNPIYTIEPTDYQTSFQWEHRTTDKHDNRQDFTDVATGVPYTEEREQGHRQGHGLLLHRCYEGRLSRHGEAAVARQPTGLHGGQDLHRGAPPRREERRELDDAQPHVKHRRLPDVHRRHPAARRVL